MIDQIIEKIMSAGLSNEEAMAKIAAKKRELSGIVSDEGAAYIVAKELGIVVNLHKRLQLSSLRPGLQSVEIIAKLLNIGDVREFKTEKAEGRVCNLVLFDSSGSTRLSLWNEEIDLLKDIKEGDTLRIIGYVKDGWQGQPEIRLGKRGILEKSGQVLEVSGPPKKAAKSSLASVEVGDSVRLRAALMQVFESPPFYLADSEGRSIQDSASEEEKKKGQHVMRLSGILDDSTSSIRAVFFREAAESVLGMSTQAAREIFLNHGVSRLVELAPVGEEFVVEGYIKHNSLFNRKELSVQSIRKIDIKEEINQYLNK